MEITSKLRRWNPFRPRPIIVRGIGISAAVITSRLLRHPSNTSNLGKGISVRHGFWQMHDCGTRTKSTTALVTKTDEHLEFPPEDMPSNWVYLAVRQTWSAPVPVRIRASWFKIPVTNPNDPDKKHNTIAGLQASGSLQFSHIFGTTNPSGD